MKPFDFKQAESAGQALRKGREESFIAGGTNLVDLMKKHIAEPDAVIDLTQALPADITTDAEGIRLGAMTRNSEVSEDKTIIQDYPLVSKAILAGASPQIRNMATTGGNILQRTRCPYFYDVSLPCNKRKPGSGCGAHDGNNRMSAVIGYSNSCVAVHPSDFCIALAALDAQVEITEADGSNRRIPFEDFHRLPGETPELDNNLPMGALIRYVRIPKNSFSTHYSYLKLRDRDSYAFALVSVAAALHMDGKYINEARLASGGVAHKPWRWREAESFLKGKEATEAHFSEAARLAGQQLRPLEKNGYKEEMLMGAIKTALKDCIKS